MIRRPPRSTRVRSSAASDVYKRQLRCHAQRGSGGFGPALVRHQGHEERDGLGIPELVAPGAAPSTPAISEELVREWPVFFREQLRGQLPEIRLVRLKID